MAVPPGQVCIAEGYCQHSGRRHADGRKLTEAGFLRWREAVKIQAGDPGQNMSCRALPRYDIKAVETKATHGIEDQGWG